MLGDHRGHHRRLFLIAFCSLAFSGGGGGGGGDKNKGASRADNPAALAYSPNVVEAKVSEVRYPLATHKQHQR